MIPTDWFFVSSDIPTLVEFSETADYSEALISAKEILFNEQIDQITDDDTANEFLRLAREWRQDTMGVSSLSDLFLHPAYQRIMGMGKPALRFILQDLRDYSGDWFHALHYIVGKDIAAGTETVEDAKAAWLEWGYGEGYI